MIATDKPQGTPPFVYAIIALAVLILLITALVVILVYLRRKNKRISIAMKALQQSENTEGGNFQDTEGRNGNEISKRVMLPIGYGSDVGYESRDNTSKMRT